MAISRLYDYKRIEYLNSLYQSNYDDLLDTVFNVANDREKIIQISKNEGYFLQFIIKAFNIKNVLELGTMFGYSTAHIACALPDDGIIYTIEKDIVKYNIAKKNLIKFNKNITFLLSDANDILYESDILEKKFDMIFIDANKASYNKYLDWVDDNMEKGSLIVADNCILDGKVYDEYDNSNMIKQLRIFNDRLSDKNRYISFMLPVYDGIFLAIKK